MIVTTIGLARKSLRDFASALQHHRVTRLVDTRLQNTSQLAGFAKKDDLKYILELLGIEYVHSLDLAPTEGMMKAIKQREISWTEFESAFIDLLAARKVESGMAAWLGEGAIPCFLCSEEKPHHCHRRLVVEYLREFNSRLGIIHI